MENLANEIKKEEHKIETAVKKMHINPWMVVSAILLIALVAASVMAFKSSGGMSKDAAAEKLVDFLNGNIVQDGSVELKSVEDKGSLYEVTVLYKGQEIPVYTTKDGKYFVQGATEIAAVENASAAGVGNATGNASTASAKKQQAATTVTKSDKPKAEAFVFSYCPYGLQFQKALLPVYNLLKDKADINLVQIGAMHGEYEKIEAYRQICIQKLYDKDKLWAYLDKFMVNTAIGACRGDAACLSPLIDPIMESLSIDKAKVDSCMTADAASLYSADNARASSLGISGSPTFVINGAQSQVSRTPDAIKTAICNAFTTAPSECSQNLSTAAMTAGFGASAGASTGASCG